MPPLAQANAAKANARKMRGEWLVLINQGVFSPHDLFQEAATHAGRPLRRLTLRQVLSAQADCSDERALRLVKKICSTLRLDPAPPPRDLTVGWLLDTRTGGTRILAYLDAIHPRSTPWPGFPMTPPPSGGMKTAPALSEPKGQAVTLPTYS